MSTPSNEEEYLLAIAADPENDELRRSFATYLRPYEPELSEFVRTQVDRVSRQRAQGEIDTSQATPEERRLLTRHAQTWSQWVDRFTTEPGIPGPRLMFHRGLVAHLTMDADLFVERGGLLLHTTVVRHIDFTLPRPGSLSRLLRCEHLAGLDSIGFPGAGLDDDAVAELAGSPLLTDCLHLDLTGNRLGARAFEAIAASPHLKNLLVVQRDPHPEPACAWHPGERSVIRAVAGGVTAHVQPMSADGHTLEDAYGHVPWLHLRNLVSRFDARWYAERGKLPVGVSGVVRVPDTVTAVFRDALREHARHSDLLPQSLEVGRVYRVDDPVDLHGQDLRVLVGIGADGRLHLDYVVLPDDLTYHGRIHADGRHESLETYEGQHGRTVPATAEDAERERIRIADHNRRVAALLRRKGFEDEPGVARRPAPPTAANPTAALAANTPRCVGCRRPVLELTGQFTRFDSYLSTGDGGRPETAGTWHLSCLDRSDVGDSWREPRLRSLGMRGYRTLAEAGGWTVMDRDVGSGQAGGERLAVSPRGALLPLAFPSAGRRETEGGVACATEVREYGLQLNSRGMAPIHEALAATGSYPLLQLAELLGIRDRLTRPDLLVHAALRFDRDLALEWFPYFVLARVYHHVFVDRELIPFLTDPPLL
ncbi:hypothetical protein [Streptomyces cavernae]|uniref:hypothetical protein n=1 Tax=Streptomyces cavernae TaxID=2259034 RepID=UPI000FEB74E8|nr:hypothetical protein [Streptomyces cavernae]